MNISLIKKYHIALAFCLLMVSLHAVEQCPPGLLKIDEQRIAVKRDLWKQEFAKNHNRRIWSLASLGAAGGAIVYGLYQTYMADKKMPVMSEEEKGAMLNQKMLMESQYWQQRTTFWGMMRWSFDVALCSSIGALCVHLLTSSESFFRRKFDELSGFGQQDRFRLLGCELTNNFAQLIQSLSVCVKTVQKADPVDVFSQKLHTQLIQGIIIDHVAFVHSFEECMAFVAQSSVDDADQSLSFAHVSDQLIALVNSFIEQEEKLVMGTDLQIINLSHGLYAELIRFAQSAGTMLYGKDFTLKVNELARH